MNATFIPKAWCLVCEKEPRGELAFDAWYCPRCGGEQLARGMFRVVRLKAGGWSVWSPGDSSCPELPHFDPGWDIKLDRLLTIGGL